MNEGLWHSADEANNKGRYYFDVTNNIYYSVENDKDVFYLHIKTKDYLTQVKILRSGLKVEMDTSKWKKNGIEILFPLPKIDMNLKSLKNPNPKPDSVVAPEDDIVILKHKYETEKQSMHLMGFRPPAGGIVPQENKFGIIAKIEWDTTTTMHYDLAIPFVMFCRNKITCSDTTKILDVEITINGLPIPPGLARGGPSGGGPRISVGVGMGGGMGGYGMGMPVPMGGGMTGGYNNYNPTPVDMTPYQNHKIKMRVRLAGVPKM